MRERTCAHDFNGDQFVEGVDLNYLLYNWGKCSDTDSCDADVDNSGEVDGSDLLDLLSAWGSCP